MTEQAPPTHLGTAGAPPLPAASPNQIPGSGRSRPCFLFLPAEAHGQVVDAALDAALVGYHPDSAVFGLVQYLTSSLVTKVLDVARSSAYPPVRAAGLIALVPFVSTGRS